MSSETQRAEVSAGHTPGPWDAGEPEGSTFSIFGPDYADGSERVIAHTYTREHAHLIAAAPDLLEALERLADRFAFDGVPEDGEEEYEEALAAIRKACG